MKCDRIRAWNMVSKNNRFARAAFPIETQILSIYAHVSRALSDVLAHQFNVG